MSDVNIHSVIRKLVTFEIANTLSISVKDENPYFVLYKSSTISTYSSYPFKFLNYIFLLLGEKNYADKYLV